MIAISLGWGVQSFTMSAMVALGDLPPVDVAIHADTTHESKLTYEFAARWTGWLEQRGLRIVTVRNVQPLYELCSKKTDIPAYTYNGKSDGILRRQCTGGWKIDPMRRWLQANRNREPANPWNSGSASAWMSFSA